jgi:hypothetical protein
MRGTIFRVMGLAAGAMLLVGLGISANASVHQFRSVGGSTGIHHEATGERHETPEPSEKPEATSKPKPTEKPEQDVETGDDKTGATEDSKRGSQNEDKSGDTKKDKGGSGGGSGSGGDGD